MKVHVLERKAGSVSIAPSQPWGKGDGDGASGVETAPKLEMERGESPKEHLRLMAMIAVDSLECAEGLLCEEGCDQIAGVMDHRVWRRVETRRIGNDDDAKWLAEATRP